MVSKTLHALNKKYMLNSECVLNKIGAWALKAGPSTVVRYPAIEGAKIAKITMEEYAILPAIALSCLLQR